MEERFDRGFPDMAAMHHRFRGEPCSTCRTVARASEFSENMVYEGGEALVFLDGYPKAYGYTPFAPREHREQVTASFTPEEYRRLRSLVCGVSEAVREEVGAERMYPRIRSGATRATPMPSGTWFRCSQGRPTRTSTGPPGPAGTRG